jgi:hypothetical protein
MRPAALLQNHLGPDQPRGGLGRIDAGWPALAGLLVLLPLLIPPAAQAVDNPPAADPAARMTVTGRVLDPQGKPVPHAAVMIIVRSRYADRPTPEQLFITQMPAHERRCDGSGRFRIEMPRTSSARHEGLIIAALAAGYGIGWIELDPDADPPTADVTLRPEQVIQGRMFDVQGQPTRGVALWVWSVNTIERGVIPTPISRPDFLEHPWHALPSWPGPAISDDDGRFTLRGMGPDLQCVVFVDDPRYALAPTVIQTHATADARALGVLTPVIKVEPGPDPKPIAIALQPARTIAGRVTYADTGQPVPHALISGAAWPHKVEVEADAEGRFRVFADLRRLDRFTLQAHPPDGAPYLMAGRQGEWPKGAVEQSVDVALHRGAVVHGKITEEGSGRPIAGAVVRFACYDYAAGQTVDLSVPAATGPDGSYRVIAPPGPGNLVVQGPSDDYVLREFGAEGGYFLARPGRRRFYAQAFRAMDLKPDEPDQEVDLTVRRGAAVHVRAIGPDGPPVRDAWVYSRVVLQSLPAGGWKEWYVRYDNGRGHAHDGRFVLHGLAPDVEVPAFFLDPERKLGAMAQFSAKAAANGPVTVRLEPCGAARARLVTSDGEPLDRYPAERLVSMVVTPGPPRSGRAAKQGPLFAEEAVVELLDSVNYTSDFQSDAQGRVTFPVLIPGAPYRIVDRTPVGDANDPAIRKEFTVKPGETLDLGDILIAKPRRRN